jgi:hypothetical protein
MEVSEIIHALEYYDGKYERNAVTEALNRRDEITPHLISILKKVTSDPYPYLENENYVGPSYAIMLLGYFSEPKAHQPIIDFVSLPDEIPSDFLGDMITVDLGAILYKTCAGSLNLIKQLVLNKTAYDYCRGAAMQSLAFSAAMGIISRDDVLSFLGPLFTGTEAYPYSDFWDLLAIHIIDLHPQGMEDVLKWGLEQELISPIALSLEEIEESKGSSINTSLEKLREELDRKSPDNFHDLMSWWAWSNE